METTITANERRTQDGKTGTRKVRRAGRLPAVVYGPNSPAISIDVEPHALVELFRKTQNRNTIVELSLDGQTIPCMVREVQRNPLTREILHVDFYRLEKSRPVSVEVPVVATGKSKGLALGGRVQVLRRTLRVACSYDRIPSAIEVDTTDLDIGDSIKVDQIRAPEGVEVVYDQVFPVISVAGKQKEAAAPAAGEAAAAEEKKEG